MSYNSGSNRARNFKSASRFALGRFRNYSPDYSLNCTPLGPITITYYYYYYYCYHYHYHYYYYHYYYYYYYYYCCSIIGPRSPIPNPRSSIPDPTLPGNLVLCKQPLRQQIKMAQEGDAVGHSFLCIKNNHGIQDVGI